MSIKSQPHRLQWESTESLQEINRRLTTQLQKADEMFEIIFKHLAKNSPQEGTWTPIDVSGGSLVFVNPTGNYIKIGPLVVATGNVTFPTTADTNQAKIGGLPFSSDTVGQPFGYGGFPFYTDEATVSTAFITNSPTPSLVVHTTAGGAITNATLSGNNLRFTVIYRTTE